MWSSRKLVRTDSAREEQHLPCDRDACGPCFTSTVNSIPEVINVYGFHAKLNASFDQAIDRVMAALKQEGFGVLSDIDVQGAMKEKLGLDMPAYRILGACNPPLAHKALQADPDVGLLLPCNVVVRQESEGHVTVAFVDPMVMMEMVKQPEVQRVAEDAAQRLRRVCEGLGRSAV
jgi:uncharacterized protein (DUF302 family)